MRWLVRLLSAWLCLAALAAAGPPQIRFRLSAPPETGTPTSPADVEKVAARLIELTNAFRKQEGRRPLAVDPALAKAANGFADFMATADKYGHTADGRKPGDRAEAAGYDYCLVDENIAWLFQTRGFSTEQLAQQLFEGWQQSSVHRENLLNPHLGEIGVAVALSVKSGRYFGVQEFGRPKSEQIAFEVSNATDAELTYRVDGKPFTLKPRYGRQHKRPIPPSLEIAGHKSPLQPATGEKYIARPGSGDRVAIELVRRPPEQAAANRASAKVAD